MQKPLFSIRDAKGDVYDRPFVQLTREQAIQSFTRVAKDPQSNINSFPEDYDLYHLGSFDDATGKIETLDTPQHVIKAVNLLNARPGGLNAGVKMAPV